VSLVIDASVALKWFLAEDGSAQASSLLAVSDSLIAPDLILAEAINACWKAVRAGVMLPKQQEIVARRLPVAFDELVSMATLILRASALSGLLDHPAYDCFYLALAEQRDAPVVTADRRLLRRVAGTGWAGLVHDLYALPS
jgi:predicted nucleic acid-binding protein